MKINIPKSVEESEALVVLVKENLPFIKDEEELADTCKQLISLVGSFNHKLQKEHRSLILDCLVAVGEPAIMPVLEDLVDCPRAE